MKPKFDSDYELDEWSENKQKQDILDNYFGKEWFEKKEEKNG